jgi:GDP/UDP-N,N'-diacetylbacillosamine 2-epimerase (hydrolysing)
VGRCNHQMRKLIYVSGTRADYGLMAKSLKLWDASKKIDVSVCVTGMHLLASYGCTVNDIINDNLRICSEIKVALHDGSGAEMAKAIADALNSMVDVFAQEKPDMVVVLGDRGEMLAGALAAIHLNIPVVHIHGGERSGTIDEPVRHAISKLSHYHLTATDEARERLIRMGELESNVFRVGAPGLDGLLDDARFSRIDLCKEIGFCALEPVVLLVFHSVVQEVESAGEQIRCILKALQEIDIQVVCLMPNSDAGGSIVRAELERANLQQSEPKRLHVVTHLPRPKFVSWMKHVDVMLGNSSSGIIEAASFNTPVVNIGNRQRGRERSRNVIDVDVDGDQIKSAVTDYIRCGCADILNVYGGGNAGEKMLDLICSLPINVHLLSKLNAY